MSVTHRLASVTGFDHIFVFENGHLMEDGTHLELLEKAGLYRRLWDKQQGFEIDLEDDAASVTPARLRAIPFLATAGQAALERFSEAFVTERFSEGSASMAKVQLQTKPLCHWATKSGPMQSAT